MYLEEIPSDVKTSTRLKIKYDCCGREHVLKYCDAKENFEKNGGKHICRPCGLKLNNPAKRQEVRDKIKKTTVERYGTTCALNKPEHVEARRLSYQNPEFREVVLQKRRTASRKKYGVDHPMQSSEVQEKQKAALRERYGVDHPLQNPDILEKTKKTNLEKYGVEWSLSSPEVRLKGVQTMLEKYGVTHYNQLPEMKEYLRENCKEWLADSYANPWAKGITRPEEWNDKQRETVALLMGLGAWKAGYPRTRKGFCYPQKCKKKEVYFRSSYEAIYCYHLDNHEDVEWFTFEGFKIEYVYKEKKRYYIPDFLIKWHNKPSLSIRELKAEFLKEDEQVILKCQCAELFAEKNGMDFEMICCKQISELNVDFDYLKEIGYVKTEI